MNKSDEEVAIMASTRQICKQRIGCLFRERIDATVPESLFDDVEERLYQRSLSRCECVPKNRQRVERALYHTTVHGTLARIREAKAILMYKAGFDRDHESERATLIEYIGGIDKMSRAEAIKEVDAVKSTYAKLTSDQCDRLEFLIKSGSAQERAAREQLYADKQDVLAGQQADQLTFRKKSVKDMRRFLRQEKERELVRFRFDYVFTTLVDRSYLPNKEPKAAVVRSLEDEYPDTGLLCCPKCKRHTTKYYEMQTRSADEPMTVFSRCLCGKRWRF